MSFSKILSLAAVSLVAATAASAATYQATSADNVSYGHYGDGHSLFLSGLKLDFEADGIFQIDDKTATLSGTVSDGSGNGYVVDMSFVEFTTPDPKLELSSNAYASNGGPVDPSTWSYWDLVEGGISTITGFGEYAGLIYDVISKPMTEQYAFQFGEGANGKNISLGLSGWLFLDGQNDASDNANRCAVPASGMGNVCDFNLDLAFSNTPPAVPLPAPAFMLLGGMAALGGLHAKKRKQA